MDKELRKRKLKLKGPLLTSVYATTKLRNFKIIFILWFLLQN